MNKSLSSTTPKRKVIVVSSGGKPVADRGLEMVTEATKVAIAATSAS